MDETIFRQVAIFQYSTEAFIYKGKLEANGVEVFMRDHLTIDTDPLISNAIGGVKLFVRSEDYLTAKSLLNEISKYSIGDNGDAVVCPACSSQKVELISSVKGSTTTLKFILTTLFGIFPISVRHLYKCSECGNEFELT